MIRGVPYDAEVEYIQSTGTQWIDTGWVFQKNIRLVFDITYMGSGAFGRNAGSYEFLWSGSSFFFGGGRSTVTRSNYVRYEMDCDFTAGKMVAKVNGSVFRQTTGTQPTDTKIVLFAMMTGNTRSPAPIRHGRFTIYKDGIAVLDLVPVRIGPEGAMYDRVSKQMFRNNGTGVFSCGPDVVTPVMGLHFTRPYVAEPTAKSYVQDGLVAMWDGEWNAGGGVHVSSGLVSWRDLSGNGLDLAMPAASAFELGEKCIRFNGTGAAESAVSNIVQASLHGTFELLVQRSKLGGGKNRVFFSCGNSAWWRYYGSTSGGPLGVYAYNSGYEGFKLYSLPNLETVQSPISFAFMFDKDGASGKSVVRTYANGKRFQSFFAFPDSYGYKADMPTSGVVSAGTTNSSDGLTSIFSVRVYDRHLTADEIAANYAIDKERFNLP